MLRRTKHKPKVEPMTQFCAMFMLGAISYDKSSSTILTRPDTPANCWFDPQERVAPGSFPKPNFVRSEDLLNQLRQSCTSGGGLPAFSYRPQDIGTHSLLTGVAMAVFLAQNSVLKIMILGRWLSAAFVKYIRPQLMEWTAGMSMSMLRSPDFRHADPSIASRPDLDSLQANLNAAIKLPEEMSFNGSPCKFVSDTLLNLEF
ncbi:hypothetical protein ACA910_010469 [Epithemia clementina (nom. ined.)]